MLTSKREQIGQQSGRDNGQLPASGVVSAVLLVTIALACFVAPAVLPIPDPVGGSVLQSNLPALSPGHLLGTDLNGDDVLSRLLYGGRESLQIALTVNLIGLAFGGFIGVYSGYRGGTLDALAMRLLDVLIAFPALLIVLAVAQTLGPSKANTILALSVFSVPAFSRVARAAALRIRVQPFIQASHLCGTTTGRLLARHFVPLILPQLATFGLLGVGIVITIEGALSFLGLGIALPYPSWGNMISHGQHALMVSPRLTIFPSAAIFVTVLCCNLLGDIYQRRDRAWRH